MPHEWLWVKQVIYVPYRQSYLIVTGPRRAPRDFHVWGGGHNPEAMYNLYLILKTVLKII